MFFPKLYLNSIITLSFTTLTLPVKKPFCPSLTQETFCTSITQEILDKILGRGRRTRTWGHGDSGGGGEEGQKARLFVMGSGHGRRVQEKPFLLHGFLFSCFNSLHNHNGAIFINEMGTIEGVRYEGRDGAENECREVKDAGRENLVMFPWQE